MFYYCHTTMAMHFSLYFNSRCVAIKHWFQNVNLAQDGRYPEAYLQFVMHYSVI